MLQAIGLTARRLQAMLTLEGLLYTVGSALLALALTLTTAPFVETGLKDLARFFARHFTL